MIRWVKKSILGLPVHSPLSRPYKTWSSTLLLLDLTYTAFIIPLGVGFNSENNSWDWFGIVDFIAGDRPDMRPARPEGSNACVWCVMVLWKCRADQASSCVWIWFHGWVLFLRGMLHGL